MRKMLFLLLTLSLASFSNPQKKHRLTIEIKGIAKSTGKIHLAVFRKTDTFPDVTSEVKTWSISAKIPTTEISMELPPDTYAIAVFHDANNSGKMDKNIFGMPTEVYGFSNDARENFSAPSFRKASFHLKSDAEMSIRLK